MNDHKDTTSELTRWVADAIEAPGELGDGAGYDGLQLAFGAKDRRAVLRLLASEDVSRLRAGVFIVNELAADAGDLIAGLGPALRTSDRGVLFDAIESCLFGDPEKHAEILGAAMRHATSVDPAVMYMVAKFLSLATLKQIEAGLPSLSPDLRELVKTLVEEPIDQGSCLQMLRNPEPEYQVVGAASCVRAGVDPSQVLDLDHTVLDHIVTIQRIADLARITRE